MTHPTTDRDRMIGEGEIEMIAVCSMRSPARTQNNHSKGHAWWARDVYHLRRVDDRMRTRCGRDCSEWLVIGQLEEVDDNCCYRCLSAAASVQS